MPSCLLVHLCLIGGADTKIFLHAHIFACSSPCTLRGVVGRIENGRCVIYGSESFIRWLGLLTGGGGIQVAQNVLKYVSAHYRAIFKPYLHKRYLKKKRVSFKGERINILFVIGGPVYYHCNDINVNVIHNVANILINS